MQNFFYYITRNLKGEIIMRGKLVSMVTEKVTEKFIATGMKAVNRIETKSPRIGRALSRIRPKVKKTSTQGFSPILPSNLKTLKQMHKFNKQAFGVKVFDVKDKDFGQFLTNGMAYFHNTTGGQFKVPKNIIVCDLPNANGFMMYESSKDILAISKKHLDKFKEIARNNGETLEQTLKRWGKRKFDGTATSEYQKGLYQELFHEFGHKAHADICKSYGNINIDWSSPDIQNIAGMV